MRGRSARFRLTILVAALQLSAVSWQSANAADRPRVAVFDFELIDTSLEGEVSGGRTDEQARLTLISDLLRRKLSESGRYVVVDQSPAAQRIIDAGYIHSCNGCEAAIARSLGADLAMTGTVQKVSNLILNVNIYVSDAASGKRLRAMSADIRSNTDQSWSRGVSYLVRNRLLKE